jgi:Uma2 family endonuclease
MAETEAELFKRRAARQGRLRRGEHTEDLMATEMDATPPETLADVLRLREQLGNVPLDRIRMSPLPGTATAEDVIAAETLPRKRLCELIDGVLVEKAMGARESLLALALGSFLWAHVRPRKLGVILGADGMLRLEPQQVRIPDVSYISWARVPGGKFPETPIPEIVPDLAVELLSESNTKGEMARKLRDYFLAGVRLVWLIQPKTQTAEAYTAPDEKRRIAKTGTLDGGTVLPGFSLPLKELFAQADREAS